MLGHYFTLANASIKLQFKTWMQYRTDYIAGLITVLLEQVITLAILSAIFTNIPTIKNWSFPEMLVIYGFTRTSLGIADAITENLWWVSSYARDGTLIIYLLRPVGVLYQLIFERIHFERFANSLIGLIFITYGTSVIDFHWHLGNVMLASYFIFLGILIYMGLMILSSAIGVLFVGSVDVMQPIFSLTEFAKYPTTIFDRYLIVLFTTFIPISMIGFYPTAVLLKPQILISNPTPTLFPTIIVGCFFSCCVAIWIIALKFYETTGT